MAETESTYESLDHITDRIAELTKKMKEAAEDLAFEAAAELRDQIKALQERELELRG